ncbi:MAG: S8 family serine peptidase, partial [Muribaculaceae bacterium]|nr:S8 family serine peptidase [Muribaculaceae bacterium]
MSYTKFDTGSRIELLRYALKNEEQSAEYGRPMAEETEMMVIVTMNPGFTTDDLKNDRLVPVSVLGDDMCILKGPVDAIIALETNNAIKSLSFGDRLNTNLDTARKFSSIDQVHNGVDLPGAYTGKGVVCGIFDTGVDPNHINFYNSEFTESRVKEIHCYQSAFGGSVAHYLTPEEIGSFKTDNNTSSHGTHTLGIMAGSFNNTLSGSSGYPRGSFASVDESTNKVSIETHGVHPYYGMAPDADIVVACGDSYESYVLAGLAKITEYAKSHNQPAVINLSLGQLVGPHDGSDAFSKGLAQIGKDAIVCISAGNDGGGAFSVVKELTEEDRFI